MELKKSKDEIAALKIEIEKVSMDLHMQCMIIGCTFACIMHCVRV